MCELVESHERRVEWWAAICAVIALVLGLATLGAFATHHVIQGDRPSDDELAANFFSHEARFDELVQMLATDHTGVSAKGATDIGLATLGRRDRSAARFRMYRGLLRQISVADFRYFPDSGKLILLPEGQENAQQPSKYYLYLPHAQPRSLVQHPGYSWRTPGVYILTGDRPLKGFWFIHHDMTIAVAVSPY